MKKEIWVVILLAVIIIILTGFLMLWPSNKPVKNPVSVIPQNIEGIQVTSPKENDQVSSPIKIIGTVNAGGWGGYEGQVGTVQLLDYKGNKIASGVLKATTDWTKNPVSFETNLVFQTKITGPMTLLFSNENPSGLLANDKKFGLSVIVK